MEVLLKLDLLTLSCQKKHCKKREKFHVIYSLIFVKNESESLLELYPRLVKNAQGNILKD